MRISQFRFTPVRHFGRLSLVLALFALPTLALAQDTTGAQAKPAAKPAAAADQSADHTGAIKSSTIDFGTLGSSITGDDARYNRYRDLSNGAFIDHVRTSVEKGGWFVDLGADNVARQDARYHAQFARPGTMKSAFQWDEIRELVSSSSVSLFTQTTPGVLRVDDNVQSALQTALGPPNTLSTVLPLTLNNFNRPFDLGTRRHIASGSFTYYPDKDSSLNFDASHTNRTGAILYSGTFGFSNAVDIPQPIDQHTTNTSLSYEHQHGDVLLRAGFQGSYFRNDIPVITWDDPYRLTDAAYAASSTGGSSLSSQGRTSVAPSNNFNVLNGSISVKIPAHSRLTAVGSLGFLDDNGATVIPQTINTTIPVVSLYRNTVGGEGHTRTMNLNFVSRPTHEINYEVRYRYYDYLNLTPTWTNTQRVAYDSALQISTTAAPLAALTTDRFGGSRSTLSADMHFVAPGGGSIGVGYARNDATYDDRIYTGSHENTAHVSFDALQTQYVSIHTNYEHSTRRGDGLDTTDMVAGGEQATLRHYDIADRDRDLFSAVATVFPVNGLSISLTSGSGEDKYPTTNFGLTSAKHYLYGAGIDADPNEHVNLSFDYTLDDFKSVQWSRNASSPAPAAVFYDPSKDWSDNAHDRTQLIQAGLNLVNLGDRVNMRFGYEYNRGRGMYVYGTGSAPLDPVVATTLPAPVQLPTLVSDLKRTTVDVSYRLTARTSLGITYWYEQFKVNDLALDSSSLPALSLGTTDILMGYQYQPYTANSVFGRVVVKF